MAFNVFNSWHLTATHVFFFLLVFHDYADISIIISGHLAIYNLFRISLFIAFLFSSGWLKLSNGRKQCRQEWGKGSNNCEHGHIRFLENQPIGVSLFSCYFSISCHVLKCSSVTSFLEKFKKPLRTRVVLLLITCSFC